MLKGVIFTVLVILAIIFGMGTIAEDNPKHKQVYVVALLGIMYLALRVSGLI